MMDINELWVDHLPLSIPLRVAYFILSYLILCFGIALSNRCKLPITPTDLFPREMEDITGKPYSKIKISYDVTCLIITACMTFFFLGHISGLGIGTVLAAFTMGKGVSSCWQKNRQKSRFGVLSGALVKMSFRNISHKDIFIYFSNPFYDILILK